MSERTPGPWIHQQPGKSPNPYIVAITCDPHYYGTPARCMVARGTPTGGQGWPAIGPGGISREEAEANAAFIVRACNAHDKLVEALEVAKETIAKHIVMCPATSDDSRSVIRDELKVISAAIAAAKGETDEPTTRGTK